MNLQERVVELDYAMHCLAQAEASLRRAGVSGPVAVAERLRDQVGFVRGVDSMLAGLDAVPVVGGNFEADVCKAEAILRAGSVAGGSVAGLIAGEEVVVDAGSVHDPLEGLSLSFTELSERMYPGIRRHGFQLSGDGCGGVEVSADE